MFFNEIAIAVAADLVFHQPSQLRLQPAIPLAEPTSAWHPPAAPEIQALFATTIPKAPAVNKNSIISSRVGRNFSLSANSTPGTVPADPAVGVAQIIPIVVYFICCHSFAYCIQNRISR